jgi:hypothetical protein
LKEIFHKIFKDKRSNLNLLVSFHPLCRFGRLAKVLFTHKITEAYPVKYGTVNKFVGNFCKRGKANDRESMFSDVEGISLKQEKHGKDYFFTLVSHNRFPETKSGSQPPISLVPQSGETELISQE